jgi:hypothetical protein
VAGPAVTLRCRLRCGRAVAEHSLGRGFLRSRNLDEIGISSHHGSGIQLSGCASVVSPADFRRLAPRRLAHVSETRVERSPFRASKRDVRRSWRAVPALARISIALNHRHRRRRACPAPPSGQAPARTFEVAGTSPARTRGGAGRHDPTGRAKHSCESCALLSAIATIAGRPPDEGRLRISRTKS